MNKNEEELLRDFLGDLVASKGSVARRAITENIVAFIRKLVAKYRDESEEHAEDERDDIPF
jgi:hypothetical protein